MLNKSKIKISKLTILLTYSLLFLFFSTTAYSQIKIVNPKPTDILLTGQDIKIQWVGNYNNAPVDLYYSTDSGMIWILISQAVINNFYDWQIPILDTLNLQFKVIASYQIPPNLLWEIPQAHQAEIRSIVFSPDSKYFLTAGGDGFVKFWDINTKGLIYSMNFLGSSIWNASFLHNTDTVIVALDSFATMWDRRNSNIQNCGVGDFKKQTRWGAVNPVYDVFAIASYDGNVRLYSSTTGLLLKTFPTDDGSEVYTVSFSSDGQYLIFGGYTGDLYLYDWANSTLARKFPTDNASGARLIWSCNSTPDNQLVAAGGVNLSTRIWNIQTGNLLDSVDGHIRQVREVLFHPNGNYLMTGSLDGFVKQWDLTTGSEVTSAINHGGEVLSAAYSITGDSILTTGRDNSVKLWKNFENFSFSDSVKCIVKYPVSVKIPNIYSDVGNNVNIPLLFVNDLKVPGIQSKLFNVDCQIEFPSQLLDIQTQVAKTNSLSVKDTISLSFQNVFMRDTLINLSALVLLGDVSRDDIKILKFQYTNDTDYVIQRYDGSINIQEYCVGASTKAILLTKEGSSIHINPNPASGNSKIIFNVIEDGFYKIKIFGIEGDLKKTLFEGKLKHGNYEFNINVYDFNCGYYLINMETPTDIINKPFVVFH